MNKILASAMLLCSANAFSQTQLRVVPDEDDRHYSVLAVDAAGQRTGCDIPPLRCELTLPSGPTSLIVRSGDRQLDTSVFVPPMGADLKLTYHHPVLGWVGIGVLAEGALDAALAGAYAASASSEADSFNRTSLQANAVAWGIIGGAALITGAILTAVGFTRAGPQVELAAIGSQQVPGEAWRSQAPPPPPPSAIPPPPRQAPPPPPTTPPPLPNVDPNWTNGGPSDT